MDKRCFCQTDIMSQCMAGKWTTQKKCWFYIKHSHYNRCSNLDTNMNNHCWSPKAQSHDYNPAGSSTIKEPKRDNLLIQDGKIQIKTCEECIAYSCDYLMHEDAMAQPRGGLTQIDLINIANKCDHYCHEDEFKGGAL